MACTQSLLGLAQSCETNLAGIKKVWITNYDDVTLADASGDTIKVSDITIAEGGNKFISYAFAKQTGSLTSTVTIDEANGVRYYTNEIALQFNKMEAKKHLEVEALAAGQLAVIVLDNNGKYWYVGADSYVSATEVSGQSGQSFGDLNGYNTTMSSMEAHMPYEIVADTTGGKVDLSTISTESKN